MTRPHALSLLAALSLAACIRGRTSPTVLPTLDSLPDDPQERARRLDSAAARPGPEGRKPLPGSLHTVETAAATAASVLGMIFSTSKTIAVGAGAQFDENALLDPSHRERTRHDARSADREADRAGGQGDDAGDVDPAQLTPWVDFDRGGAD